MQGASEPVSPKAKDRRVFRWYLVALAVPAVGILLALAAGVPPQRLRAAIGFQVAALVAAAYFIVTTRIRGRTARRQRRLESLAGIQFKTPWWTTLMECSIPIEIGGALAAVVATLGFAGVGSGLFLTFGLIGLAMPLFKVGVQPRSIVLEDDGIKLSVSRASFVIPWATIVRVEEVGPDHFVALKLILRESEPILKSVQPDQPRARDRIRTLIQGSPHGRTEVFLMPWASGLDGRTLALGIRDGMRGSAPAVN